MEETISMQDIGKRAKEASRRLAIATKKKKNLFLELLAKELEAQQELILESNRKDVSQAKENGTSEAMLDRLSLKGRLEGIIKDVHYVSTLQDPVGEIFEQQTLPNGLNIHKLRTPLGVLGVIYEARPNVTVDISTLAIKTGNAVILRGGSETLNTNKVLVKIIGDVLESSGLPKDAVQLIASPDRALVQELIKLDKYVDMIIPRGGNALQEFCKNNSTIPVITGGVGICHLFMDEDVNLEASLHVILNAKIQRPAACNALDTLLIHKSIASKAVPAVMEYLSAAGVYFHLDERAIGFLTNKIPDSCWKEAQSSDWDTEWLGMTLGIKIVNSLEEAIDHIAQHSMSHSYGILTSNREHADHFVAMVDSACVYVNASTRFTDGGQLGLGAEVAVTTQKLHARGPMGLKELTTYKWVVEGDYHART